jgi:EpsI family protein
MKDSMGRRAVILSVCLIASAGINARATRMEPVLPREPLSQFPQEIGGWRGQDLPPLTENVRAVLGTDEYVNRVYVRDRSYVALYLGYYATQREGDTIHSPLNCLPGAGWQPVSASRVPIASGASDAPVVNRFVIQKGADRQLVLYWYQSHGRVVASEYWGRAFMVYDAMRLNRTDAALVRVISPILGSETTETSAADRAFDFARSLFPQLSRYLPA